MDLRRSLPPQVAKKASEVHNTTFFYPESTSLLCSEISQITREAFESQNTTISQPKSTSLLSKSDRCKIESLEGRISHQLGLRNGLGHTDEIRCFSSPHAYLSDNFQKKKKEARMCMLRMLHAARARRVQSASAIRDPVHAGM